MKLRTVLFLFYIMTASILYAQEQEKIRVKAGEDFSEALNSYGIYRFPTFTNAVISFRNGTQSSARLNYNLALAEMQFIGNNNDTLVIANPEEIRYMLVDTVSFFYGQVYMEMIAGSDEIKLAYSQQIQIEFEKIGAFGKTEPGVDIKSYKTTPFAGPGVYELKANEDRVITKKVRYFLIDKYEHASAAGKSSFFRFFPQLKTGIQDYLKNNKINFNNLSDLRKLFWFCTEQK